MSAVTETTLYIFGLIALGYVSGVTGYLKTEVGDGLSAFAVRVALPLLLFSTLTQADFAGKWKLCSPISAPSSSPGPWAT